MAADLGPMDPIASPETIYNMDIIDLANRIDDNMTELARCASASTFHTTEHDIKRARAATKHFRERFNVWNSQPNLDLPKTHPRQLALAKPPALNRVQNSDVQSLINMWTTLRIEMTHSESAEWSSGFSPFDAGRVTPLLDKIDIQIDTIEANPELDLPDVNPQKPGANPGQPH